MSDKDEIIKICLRIWLRQRLHMRNMLEIQKEGRFGSIFQNQIE